MRPWFWMSWITAASIAACGGKVVLDTTAATSTSGSGGQTGVGGAGTTTFGPESSSVFSSSVFGTDETATSTSFVSSGDGVPACSPCGAILLDGAPVSSLCPGQSSGLAFMNLVSCLCSSVCSMPCNALCFMAVQACEQDTGM